MKVEFAELDEMLSELREKEITEVRVAPLYDEKQTSQGITFLKMYVAVQALMSSTLIAHWEEITFRGIKPFSKEDMKFGSEKNMARCEEIKESVRNAGFTVRAGCFKEG